MANQNSKTARWPYRVTMFRDGHKIGSTMMAKTKEEAVDLAIHFSRNRPNVTAVLETVT